MSEIKNVIKTRHYLISPRPNGGVDILNAGGKVIERIEADVDEVSFWKSIQGLGIEINHVISQRYVEFGSVPEVNTPADSPPRKN